MSKDYEEYRDKKLANNIELKEAYENIKTRGEIMTILEDMIDCKADGIVFYPIMSDKVICEYTLEEFKKVKSYPKSNWRLYKMVDGKREWI